MEFLKSWDFWKIVVIVCSSIVGVLLLYFIISIIFACSINKKLNKRSESINLIVVQRYDMLVLIRDFFISNNIQINEQIKAYLENNVVDSLSLSKDERKIALSQLSKAFTGLMYLADSYPNVKKENQFNEYMVSYVELDEIYRQSVAKYNSDVAAYNYWVSVFLYKWFFKLIKFVKKDIIV